MSNKFIFLFFLLFPALNSYGQYLTASKSEWGGYQVYGYVDSNMMVPGPRISPYSEVFTVAVHSGGNKYFVNDYIGQAKYCPDNAEGAAQYINQRLNGTDALARYEASRNSFNPAWSIIASCDAGPNKTWSTGVTVATPPDSASCRITYPDTVSFGNVTLGTRKDVNSAVKINCNNLADITMSFSKQTVSLGDASVNYYFPDNKKSYLLRVNKNIPASFNMRFSLESTGNTLGYKSGDAVMIFSWQ